MMGARGYLRSVCLLAALAAGPAVAGTVYRCDSPEGGRVYASKRVPGAKCTAVSTYRKSAETSAPVALPTQAPAVGNAVPANPVAGAVPTSAQSAPAVDATPKRARFLRMASATTYSYVDANGVRNYSNRRPKGVANVVATRMEYPVFEIETCFACAINPSVNFRNLRLNTTSYASEIAAAARDFGVEEAVVRAIIHAESAYRPNALSRVGAQGLMQLMPATARRFGVANAFDPGQNIRGGVQYLSWLLKRFNGDLTLAAAGYNAGEGAVDKYKGVPPYSETRRYVERVGVLADRYRGTLAAR